VFVWGPFEVADQAASQLAEVMRFDALQSAGEKGMLYPSKHIVCDAWFSQWLQPCFHSSGGTCAEVM
jgi:hypothetical protein